MTIGSRSSISGDFDAGSIPHTIVVDDGVTRDGSLASLSGSISLVNVSVYASNCSAWVLVRCLASDLHVTCGGVSSVGVLEGSGHGGLLLDGVVIAPGPRPPTGATAPRILATNADAVQVGGVPFIVPQESHAQSAPLCCTPLSATTLHRALLSGASMFEMLAMTRFPFSHRTWLCFQCPQTAQPSSWVAARPMARLTSAMLLP